MERISTKRVVVKRGEKLALPKAGASMEVPGTPKELLYVYEWFKAESKKEAQKRAKKEAPKQKPEKSPAKKPEQKKRSLFGWLKK